MDSRIWFSLILCLACICTFVSAEDASNTTSTATPTNTTSNETTASTISSSNSTANETTTVSSSPTANETATVGQNVTVTEATTDSSNSTANETTTVSSNPTANETATVGQNVTSQPETSTMPSLNTTVSTNTTTSGSNTTSEDSTSNSTVTGSTGAGGENITSPSTNMTTSTEQPDGANTTTQNITNVDNTTSSSVDNSTSATLPTVSGNDTTTENSTETNSTMTTTPSSPGDNTTNSTDADTSSMAPTTSTSVVTSTTLPPKQDLYPPQDINTGSFYTLEIPFSIGNNSNETSIEHDITEKFKKLSGFKKVVVRQRSTSRVKRDVTNYPWIAELLFAAADVNAEDSQNLAFNLTAVLKEDLANIMTIDSNVDITIETFVNLTRTLCKATMICFDAYSCETTPTLSCIHKCTNNKCDAERPCEVVIFRNGTTAPQCRFKAEEMPERLPNWTYIIPSVIGGVLLIALIATCVKLNRASGGYGNDDTKYSMNPMYGSS